MTRLINIDNGGTLTDFCLVDGGEVRYTKTLTTPYDLSRCLFDGLTKVSELVYGEPQLAALLQSTDYIRYSTTQGTNALVQRAGPRLGLLVADPTVVEGLAATQAQEDLLAALVGGRWAAISLDLDDEALGAELVARVNDLSARGARRLVVAIGGPDGADREARIKGLLLRLYPRHLLGAVPLLFSWELVADTDDIRRTWSSLVNAFLHPAMELFLFNADRRLRDARARQPLRIFRNDGGSSRVSKSAAIKTYSSGPRGGLEGTRALAGHYGLRHLVMVDVGGTTTDIGVVSDGAIRVDRRGLIDDAPSSLELAAITSYGVGGSSIFRVADGQIQVGPESVGAAPGPACFGLGGDEATLTDVLLLTGLLDPATYLGGTMMLHPDRSAKAIQTKIAERHEPRLRQDPVRLRRAGARRAGIPPHASAGAERSGGGAGGRAGRPAGDQLRRGRAAGPDVGLARAAAGLGHRDPRAAGRRRRPQRQAARHAAGVPARERQLQDHRGTSHPAQEHGPVPGAQG